MILNEIEFCMLEIGLGVKYETNDHLSEKREFIELYVKILFIQNGILILTWFVCFKWIVKKWGDNVKVLTINAKTDCREGCCVITFGKKGTVQLSFVSLLFLFSVISCGVIFFFSIAFMLCRFCFEKLLKLFVNLYFNNVPQCGGWNLWAQPHV